MSQILVKSIAEGPLVLGRGVVKKHQVLYLNSNSTTGVKFHMIYCQSIKVTRHKISKHYNNFQHV